ncbi:hypothetical protein Zm00014a_015343, partial [Zea mays]
VVWKLKPSLKIKVSLWYLKRGVILTKDNLASITKTRQSGIFFLTVILRGGFGTLFF